MNVTEEGLQQTAKEIERAKLRAKSQSDLALIRECEAALTLARLRAARQNVSGLDRTWDPVYPRKR